MSESMKALTVWQPWASLIMIGAKPEEFRTWDFRNDRIEPLSRHVIHAGARMIRQRELHDIIAWVENDHHNLDKPLALSFLYGLQGGSIDREVIEFGAGLGTAIFGVPRWDDELGLWAFPLSCVERFDAPVPMRGWQRFWNWPGSQ